VAADN